MQPSSDGEGRARVSEIMGHVDLLPTMLDAFGLAELPAHGKSLFDPFLSRSRLLVHTLREPGTPQRWEGATDGYFHYVAGPRGRQLFHLEPDPAETTDVGASERPRLVQLETAIAEELKKLPALDAKAVLVRPDSAEQEVLRGLGYVGDGDEPDDEAEDR